MAAAAQAALKLRKLQGQIENPEEILDEIGDRLRKSTISRFFSKTSPTGRVWKRTKRPRGRAGRRGGTLVLTGALRDSITAVVSQGKVEIGTDIWYGRIHQEGGRLDARYRLRARKRGPGIGRLVPNAANIRKLISTAEGSGSDAAIAAARETLSLLGGRKRARRQRRVRIPRRQFLGVSSRDRKRTTEILVERLKEAMK